MMVRMRQLWSGGKKVDRRLQLMQSDPFVLGHLVITSEKGERYAALVEHETALPKPKDLLPRLWSAEVVSCQWGRINVRGYQRDQGQLCMQEWECTVIGHQDRSAS